MPEARYTDAHSPGDYLTQEQARRVALGGGLDEYGAPQALGANPRRLLEGRWQ